MLVKMLTVGAQWTNCYIIGDSKTLDALIIDPGFDTNRDLKKTLDEISSHSFRVKIIVNTHGHPDHTSGNKAIKNATGAPIVIHEYDAPMLVNPSADKILHDGDVVRIGEVTLRVLHTPGHSRGSISLLGDNIVFCGDALFNGSIGRFDLPGGSGKELMHSLKNRLLILPDHVRVYPGHGPATTIGEERRSNPFLQDFSWAT